MLLHAPPPPEPAGAFVIDWSRAARECPTYRAPWEARPGNRSLPARIPTAAPPNPYRSMRMRVQRAYWFSPAADFFLGLGLVLLAQPSSDPRIGHWITEPGLLPDPWGPAPAFSNLPWAISHPFPRVPFRAQLLPEAE